MSKKFPRKLNFVNVKFSLYLSGSTSSLSFCSNLLYLLRKYKITTIKSTNAVMQPIALPTIIFFLVHFSLISVLSSIWVLVGVESKLNRFSLYFQEKKNKLIWIQIKMLSSGLNYTSLRSLEYFNICGKRNRNEGYIWSRTDIQKNFIPDINFSNNLHCTACSP